MQYLIILNDPPYGSERSYNGLRLATSLAKSEGTGVSVFLIGDAASCAVDRANDSQRLLQHRTDAEASGGQGSTGWRMRLLHGCSWHQTGDAGRGSASQLDGRTDPLDRGSRQGPCVLTPNPGEVAP